MKQLIFVTGNDNKAREAATVLGVEVKRVKLELDEIQSTDLRSVVEHKVRAAYAKLKHPLIAEDVSFEIKALGGFPGTFVRWFFEGMTYDKLCRLLNKERRVNYHVAYGYFDGKQFIYVNSTMKGSIAKQPKGTHGFGFDVILIPDGCKKTLAELGDSIKLTQGPRIQSLKKLKKIIRQ